MPEPSWLFSFQFVNSPTRKKDVMVVLAQRNQAVINWFSFVLFWWRLGSMAYGKTKEVARKRICDGKNQTSRDSSKSALKGD